MTCRLRYPGLTRIARRVRGLTLVLREALREAGRTTGSGPVFDTLRVHLTREEQAEVLAEILAGYPNAKELVWLQEEPENMGPWNGVKGRLYEVHGDTHRIRRVSRSESGSPATGVKAIHDQEHEELFDRAFADPYDL